jgi:hypothetical protein
MKKKDKTKPKIISEQILLNGKSFFRDNNVLSSSGKEMPKLIYLLKVQYP